MKTTTNIRQWGSSAFNCLEIMFKILQDRCYGLDSKQKLYNAAKGKKKNTIRWQFHYSIML